MQPNSEKTEAELRRYGNLVPFKAGAEWRGNRFGRPRGSRHKLAETFLADLHDMWELHGPTILLAAAQRDPLKFAEMAAGLIPKTFELDVNATVVSHEERLRALG